MIKLLPIILVLLCGLSVSAQPLSYPTEVGALNPDLYWRLGEASGTSFADSSGDARTGTSTGSVTAGVASLLIGDADKAASFGGGSISSGLFFTSGSAISVSMVIKFDALNSTQDVWSVGTASSQNGYLLLRYASSQLQVFFSGDGITKMKSWSGLGLITGRTYNFAVTVDTVSKTVSLYQDGGLISAQVYTGAFGTISNKAVKIGSSTFAATVDEFALFPSLLPAASVQTLFRAMRGIDPSVTTYYASTTGTFEATGTLGDPFDLREVLAMPGVLGPGMTLEIRGGTYSDTRSIGTANPNFRIAASGAPDNPIKIRPYQNEVVKIDGGGHFASTVEVNGGYVELSDLEVFKSDTGRVSTEILSSDPDDISRGTGAGIAVQAPYVKVINCRVHDNGVGINAYTPATGFEAYGNLVYNNGWRTIQEGDNHGPGLYIQNDSDVEKLMEDNIVVNGYKLIFFQLRYNDSLLVQRNLRLLYNTTVNGSPQLLRGIASNITFDRNQVYNGAITFGDVDRNTRYNGTVINNRVYAGVSGTTPLHLQYWNELTVSGNELIQGTAGGDLVNLKVNSLTGQGVEDYLITGNKYWRGRMDVATNFELNTWNGTTLVLDDRTYANWQNHVGLGGVTYDSAASGSTYTDTAPTPAKPTTNVYIVRPNRYKTGRANLIIWNWEALSTLPVNISTISLVPGQAFEVRNAYNWDAGPVTFTYNGTPGTQAVWNAGIPTITLTPTTDRALRIGDTATTPTMSTEFQVFVVNPLAQSGGPTAPTNLTATWAFSSQRQPGNVVLNWTDNSSTETGFIIEKSTNGTTWSSVTTTAANATSYTVTGLTAVLTYFRIRATDGAIESVNLGPVTETATTISCFAATCTR